MNHPPRSQAIACGPDSKKRPGAASFTAPDRLTHLRFDAYVIGSTYFNAQLAFEESTVIGVSRSGSVLLNPSGKLILESGDQLIVIAEDDSTIRLGQPRTVTLTGITHRDLPTPLPERILVRGENQTLSTMLIELDQYVAAGSSATVVTRRKPRPLPELANLTVSAQQGDATNRRTLEQLEPTTFDHIIVLADMSIDTQQADSRTLVTLLHLRDIARRAGTDLNIVTEMLDDANSPRSPKPTTSSSATSSSRSLSRRSQRTECWRMSSMYCSPAPAAKSTCTPLRTTSS